jgi:hypothetical protein
MYFLLVGGFVAVVWDISQHVFGKSEEYSLKSKGPL